MSSTPIRPPALTNPPPPSTSVFVPAAIVVAGLYFGRPVLLPLALAILLAFIVSPLVVRLARIGLGRVGSVLISVTLYVAIIGAVATFVGSQGARLAEDVPLYQANLTQKLEGFREDALTKGLPGRIINMVRGLGAQLQPPSPAPVAGGLPRPKVGMQPVPVEIRQAEPAPLQLLTDLLRPLVHPVSLAGMVLVFVVFILLQKDDLQDRFIRLVGARDIQRTKRALDDGAQRLSRFLLTQVVINSGFGLVIGAGLALLGIPSPILWGLLFGIMRFIPYIGVPLASIFPLALAVAVGPDWSLVFYVGLMIFASELVVGQVVEPLLYSQSMGLSTVAVVISATFWTWLWGPVGLLLSTPLTMCLVVLGQHVERLEFLHVLLSDEPALSPEQVLYLRLLTEDPDDEAVQAEMFLKDNTIEAYCDQIALRALALAQVDANRGALEPEGCAKINEAIKSLVRNLSESRHEARGASPQVSHAHPSVLCVAGKATLDEAAAHLLAHVLEERGIAADVASSSEVSATLIDRLDVTGKKIVCLCYVDARLASNPTYVLRRLRRKLPAAAFVTCYWGVPVPGLAAIAPMDVSGSHVVTSMSDAATQVAMLLEDPKPARLAPVSG